MVMAFVGRFLITVTMNVGHQYPVEVLPTVARGQGMGTMQTLGFASAFASPYIVYLVGSKIFVIVVSICLYVLRKSMNINSSDNNFFEFSKYGFMIYCIKYEYKLLFK